MFQIWKFWAKFLPSPYEEISSSKNRIKKTLFPTMPLSIKDGSKTNNSYVKLRSCCYVVTDWQSHEAQLLTFQLNTFFSDKHQQDAKVPTFQLNAFFSNRKND